MKWQQAPIHKKNSRQKPALKWNPRNFIGWTRHYITTAANQNEGGKAFEARTFTIWPAKRNDLKRAVLYLAARSDWYGALNLNLEVSWIAASNYITIMQKLIIF